MLKRTILHSDLNGFYASVEALYRPELRNQPLAVAGDPEARHGIILAKNELAKPYGIKTGMAIWMAKQRCPNLVVVPPDYKKYLRFGRMAREIYGEYTNQVEPFGLDEAWLDVSGSASIYGDGSSIANRIRQRMKDELGISCSVGVSDNKIFAKLGSDMQKPDATTILSSDNFRQKVWPLPAGDLLYVGPATRRKLANVGMLTIGDVATAQPEVLRSMLGKWGLVIWQFANGLDDSPVGRQGESEPIKSIGNSTTTPRDLVDLEDVSLTLWVLSESVASRLRDHGFKARTVQIYVRDNKLGSYECQAKLTKPSALASELHTLAVSLFDRSYHWERPVRSVGVRGADLVTANGHVQLSLFEDEQHRDKLDQLERAVDTIRGRFGYFSVQRAAALKDRKLSGLNPKEDHVIHPVGYF